MSVEKMDRLVAALPEWEGSPAPAACVSEPVLPAWRERRDECRRRMDDRMQAINRIERLTWLLVSCLLAGVAVAGIVHTRSAPTPPAKFLPEQP